jgi:hypothetical protein
LKSKCIKGCILPRTDTSSKNNTVIINGAEQHQSSDQAITNTVHSVHYADDLINNNTNNSTSENQLNVKNWQTNSSTSTQLSNNAQQQQHNISHTEKQHQPHQQNYSNNFTITRRPYINETVFRIYKGCKTFDFSFEKNLLITGGIFLVCLFISQNKLFDLKFKKNKVWIE